MTDEEFECAVSRTRLKERARRMAYAILVEGVSAGVAAEREGVSRQRHGGRSEMLSAHFIKIQVEIEVEPDEGGFHAWCPAFKGLHVCGETEAEALAAAEDAIIAYIQSLMKHGDPLPVGCDITDQQIDP